MNNMTTDEHEHDRDAEIVRLRARMDAHEESCATLKKITFWIVGGLFAVIVALFGQILVISGRQEVVLATIQEHTSRMNAITLSIATKDEAMRVDLKDIQRMMQDHVMRNK